LRLRIGKKPEKQHLSQSPQGSQRSETASHAKFTRLWRAAKSAKKIGTQIHTAPSTRSGQANTDLFTAENASAFAGSQREATAGQEERRKITRSKPAQEVQASKRIQRPFEASSSSCPCCRTQPPLLAVLSRGFIPQSPSSPIQRRASLSDKCYLTCVENPIWHA
jgi:hypothetical protein